jgi:hypothetical protein
MKTLKCKKCDCEGFMLLEQEFANGTKHVRAQCANERCEAFFQYLPQREPSETEDTIKALTIELQTLKKRAG